jgi:SHS2 domain-containing protein
MGTFEAFDHTADVGIVMHAPTLPDLFETAADGMFSFIVDGATVEDRTWLERVIEADDVEGLLVAWLSDLLTVFAAEAFVPKTFVVDEVTDHRVRATVHGEPVDPARHRFRLDVKAVTYHQLEIAQEKDGWRARVIFDV